MDPLLGLLARLGGPQGTAPPLVVEARLLAAYLNQELLLTLEAVFPEGARLQPQGGPSFTASGTLPYPPGTELRVQVQPTAEGGVRLQILEARPPAPPAVLAPLLQGEASLLLGRLLAADATGPLANLRTLAQPYLAPMPPPLLSEPGVQALARLLGEVHGQEPAPAGVSTTDTPDLPIPPSDLSGTTLERPAGTARPAGAATEVPRPPQREIPGPTPGSPGGGRLEASAPAPGPPAQAPAGEGGAVNPEGPSLDVRLPGAPRSESPGPGAGGRGDLLRATPEAASALRGLLGLRADAGLAPLVAALKDRLPGLVPDRLPRDAASPPKLPPVGAEGAKGAEPRRPETLPPELPARILSLPESLRPAAREALQWVRVLVGEQEMRTEAASVGELLERVLAAATGRKGAASPVTPSEAQFWRALVRRQDPGLPPPPWPEARMRDLLRGMPTLSEAQRAPLEALARKAAGAPEAPPLPGPESPTLWRGWIEEGSRVLADPVASPREAPFHALQALEHSAYLELPLPWASGQALQLWVEWEEEGHSSRELQEARMVFEVAFSRLGRTRAGVVSRPEGLRVRLWLEDPDAAGVDEEALRAGLLEGGRPVDLRILPFPEGAPGLRELAVAGGWGLLG